MVLKPKLDKLLRKKLPQNRHVRGDETNVIVSVNHRSEHDLIKRFEDIDVDWPVVEKQLIAWSDLFRSGKKLSRSHLQLRRHAAIIRQYH